MPLGLGDAIRVTCTDTGSGNLTLDDAFDGLVQSVADAVIAGHLDWGDAVYYEIHDATDREVGLGKITNSGSFGRLDSRVPSYSTNAGAVVNWPAGTKYVSLGLNADALRASLWKDVTVGVLAVGETDGGGRTRLRGSAITDLHATTGEILVGAPLWIKEGTDSDVKVESTATGGLGSPGVTLKHSHIAWRWEIDAATDDVRFLVVGGSEIARLNQYKQLGLGTSTPATIGTWNAGTARAILNVYNGTSAAAYLAIQGNPAALYFYDTNGTSGRRFSGFTQDSNRMSFDFFTDAGGAGTSDVIVAGAATGNVAFGKNPLETATAARVQVAGELEVAEGFWFDGLTTASPTGTGWSESLDVHQGNIQKVDLSGATGAGTITVSTTNLGSTRISEGCIVVRNAATAVDITWAGTNVKWLGTEPTWTDDDDKIHLVGYLWDGTNTYLWSRGSTAA